MFVREVVTTKTEVWKNEANSHRYVFRRQWYTGSKEDKTQPLAIVFTIRPANSEPYVTDLSLLLIEKNCRQLGFSGFIAVNLFSLIQKGNKINYKKGNDKHSLEAIEKALTEKRIQQIIFACGSIAKSNKIANELMIKIYDALSESQKSKVKVLVDSKGEYAHPLNVHVRDKWELMDYTEPLNKLKE